MRTIKSYYQFNHRGGNQLFSKGDPSPLWRVDTSLRRPLTNYGSFSTLYTAILCYSNPMLYMLLHAVHLVHSNPDPNRTLRVSIFFRWRRWNLSETDRTERTIVKERRTICCEMCLLMRHLKWTLPRPRLFFFLGASSHLHLCIILSTL